MDSPILESEDKIRVLIVDSNPDTREKVRFTLLQEKKVDVVGVARSGKETLNIAHDTQPDVVLIEPNTPDMDEIALTEALGRTIPFTQVIILALEVDPAYIRRAMLAGARDFIVKPVLPDELRAAVYRAGSVAQEKRIATLRILPSNISVETSPTRPIGPTVGQIIQVYSPKGGAGTTTLAVNLAASLCTPTTRVALVDARLQMGDTAVFLNEVGYHSVVDLSTRVDELDPDVVASVMLHHEPTGLDILAAPARPEMADKVDGEHFYKILKYLRKIYPYVVVDTPTALNTITLTTLDVMDVMVLVCTQEIPAIKNTRQLLTVLDGLKIDRERVVLVLNRYDRQVPLPPREDRREPEAGSPRDPAAGLEDRPARREPGPAVCGRRPQGAAVQGSPGAFDPGARAPAEEEGSARGPARGSARVKAAAAVRAAA